MPGVPRVATRDTVIDDGEEESGGGAQKKMKKILEGQMVFVATSKAAMDPKAFPEPEKLDPYRPLSSYILLGHVSFPPFFIPSIFYGFWLVIFLTGNSFPFYYRAFISASELVSSHLLSWQL